MNNRKSRKTAAILAAMSISTMAVLGGTYAVYTDQASKTQVLQAGTVDIEITNEGAARPFTDAIKPMAPGDSFARYATLKNVGNLGVTNLSLSQANSGTPLITDKNGVDVSVETCSVPWIGGACGGDHYNNVNSMKPKNWNSPIFLDLPELAPADSWYVKFTTSLPNAAANNLQDAEAWVSYTFNGVQPGSKHYAEDGTTTVTAEPVVTAAAPEVSFSSTPDGGVQLDWNPVPDADSYTVDRSDDPTTSPSNIGSTPDTSFVDDSVEEDALYYYQVNSAGSAPAPSTSTSNTDWVPVVLHDGAVQTPEFKVTELSSRSQTLNWTVPNGIGSVVVSYAPTAGGASTEVWSGAEGTFTQAVTGLNPLTSYTYTLTYYSGANRTGAASSLTVAQSTGMDASVLTAAATEDSRVALNWTKPSGMTSYRVERATTADFSDAITVTNADGLSTFTDGDVTFGATYYYRMVAQAGSLTTTSATASVTVSTLTVAWEPASFNGDDTKVNLDWSNVAGADTYVVKAGTASGTYGTEVYRGTASQAAINVANHGGFNYYQVTALKSNGSNAAPASDELRVLMPLGGATATDNVSVVVSGAAATATIGRTGDLLGADSYKLQYREAGATNWLDKAMTSATVDLSLDASKVYEVRIQGLSTAGATKASSVVTIAASAQDYHMAAIGNSGNVALSWDSIPANATLTLQRSTASNFAAFDNISLGATATSYVDASVAINTPYYYRLAVSYAKDGVTFQGNSATVSASATVIQGSTPTVTTVDNSTQTVGWTVPATVGSGVLTATEAGGGTTELWRGVAGDYSQSFSGLKGGTEYTYTLTLYTGANGTGTASPAVTASAYTNLDKGVVTAGGATTSSIDLTIALPKGTTSYVVERSADVNFSTPVVLPVAVGSTTYSDSALSPNTDYYYRVKASGVNGTSSVSTVVTATTNPMAMVLSESGASVADGINLSWNAVPGATSYKLYNGPTATTFYFYDSASGSSTNADFPFILPGTWNYFRVEALVGSKVVGQTQVLKVASPLVGELAPITQEITRTAGSTSGTFFAYQDQTSDGSLTGNYTLKYEKLVGGTWNEFNGTTSYTGGIIPSIRVTATAANGLVKSKVLPEESAGTATPITFGLTSDNANGAVKVTFQNNTGMGDLTLERSKSDDFSVSPRTFDLSNAPVLNGTTSVYEDTTVVADTTYYYRIIGGSGDYIKYAHQYKNISAGQEVTSRAAVAQGSAVQISTTPTSDLAPSLNDPKTLYIGSYSSSAISSLNKVTGVTTPISTGSNRGVADGGGDIIYSMTYAANGKLSTISKATGEVATSVSTGVAYPMDMLLGSDGFIYVTSGNGGIYKVNKATGASTIFSPIAVTFNDIYESTDGFFYATAGGGKIYKVNKTTGAATVISLKVDTNPQGITEYNGALYVTETNAAKVYRVNKTTGVTTDLGVNLTGFGQLDTIVASDNGFLYVGSTSGVFKTPM